MILALFRVMFARVQRVEFTEIKGTSLHTCAMHVVGNAHF
jgi:hypothetical protein